MAKNLNNGATIPDECDCIWCGGKMHNAGITYMGSGINQFAMWCDDCGAVVINARHSLKKIDGFSIEYRFDETNKPKFIQELEDKKKN